MYTSYLRAETRRYRGKDRSRAIQREYPIWLDGEVCLHSTRQQSIMASCLTTRRTRLRKVMCTTRPSPTSHGKPMASRTKAPDRKRGTPSGLFLRTNRFPHSIPRALHPVQHRYACLSHCGSLRRGEAAPFDTVGTVES